jgi:CDP-2,3-bis-(O-geranylgeranyl)-sn-glycerol synthase
MLLNIPELALFIIPAYIANAFPVLLGGGLPLDFGKNFLDGNLFSDLIKHSEVL